jgi:hypothetical protein
VSARVRRAGGVTTVAIAFLVGLIARDACADPTSLPAALLDASADRIVARTVVPDEFRKVGEVRLATRGDATVVQTALATKVLSRVVAEIRKKEEANWPADAIGHEDMTRYVEGLERAAAALRGERAVGGDRRLQLLIEFVAGPAGAGVLLAGFEGEERSGAITVKSRTPIATLALRRTYVHRNMRLILADSFHLPESELGRLGPLGPIAPASEGTRP